MSITYKDAGVDVTEGYRAVDLMKKHIKSTFDDNVLGDVGGFGGFYSLENFNIEKPVLVAGTDGVGTKLKYSFALEKYDTVGIDCVAMCVNDIVCQGARPLFFLDYIATGKLVGEVAAEIVKGIAVGCRQSSCALIGGETAEMPGFYPDNEYDLAGFSVGIVGRDKILNGKNIAVGDTLIGLASSGLHSNGFSLVRKIFSPDDKELLSTFIPELNSTLGDAILTPTRIYVKTILALIDKFDIKGIAHITGGGFIENIPRMLPDKQMGADIDLKSYPLPYLFSTLVDKAKLTTEQAYNTFNMGIGMVLAVSADIAQAVVDTANQLGEQAYIIGSVTDSGGINLV